ncbi:3beta-hydroxysteroid-dehydrogenase/decarboxylase isoform 3 [Linum perenne]
MAMEVPISNSQSPRSCVVLGGQGFVGISLILRILKIENWIIRIADYPQSISLDPTDVDYSIIRDAISSGRASYHHIDVCDPSLICKVSGAKNVINACKDCKVRKLIYNSTADVIFDGSHDLISVDESFSCQGKVSLFHSKCLIFFYMIFSFFAVLCVYVHHNKLELIMTQLPNLT